MTLQRVLNLSCQFPFPLSVKKCLISRKFPFPGKFPGNFLGISRKFPSEKGAEMGGNFLEICISWKFPSICRHIIKLFDCKMYLMTSPIYFILSIIIEMCADALLRPGIISLGEIKRDRIDKHPKLGPPRGHKGHYGYSEPRIRLISFPIHPPSPQSPPK